MKYTVALIFSLLAITVFAQGEWELKKNDENIKVWLKNTPHSPYKSFKASTVINVDYTEVYTYLRNLNILTDYYHGISAVTDINQLSDDSATYFLEMDFPWPVKPRRAFVISKAYPVETGAYEIETKAIDTDKNKESHVTVREMNSLWKIINMGNGQTRVTTIAHMDPAGSLPGWVVNAFLIDTPFETLKSLKKILEAN